MKTYMITTKFYMKPYNEDKYWIDRDYCRPFETEADSFMDALQEYRSHVEEYGVSISDNAIRHIEKTEYGTYWLTGKTLIVDRSADVCSWQYIDVCIRPRAFVEEEVVM